MRLEPVFKQFWNLLHSSFGIEHYFDSSKALMLTKVNDREKKEYIVYGFLFKGVISTSQIPNNSINKKQLGCGDDFHSHVLYQSNLENGYKRFVTYTDYDLVIIEAKSVELIEGLKNII